MEVLRRHPNSKIVGIARDSVDAIQKSWELKPDVVLLDVGLGRADRLQVARRITEISPKSCLLLLGTAESSQLAELALSIGADGFVSKRDVVVDLLPTMQALLKIKRFRIDTNS